MQLFKLLVLAGVQLLQVTQAQHRPKDGDWLEILQCNPYEFRVVDGGPFDPLPKEQNWTLANVIDKHRDGPYDDNRLRQFVRANCNNFVQPPALPPNAPTFNVSEDVERCEDVFPGKWTHGHKQLDDVADKKCQYDQCMARYRRPMVVTEAFPVLYKAQNSYYVDYLTAHGNRTIATDHWDHTKTSHIRYPLTSHAFTIGIATRVIASHPSTITTGPTPWSAITGTRTEMLTYRSTMLGQAQARPPWDLRDYNRHNGTEYVWGQTEEDPIGTPCWDYNSCSELCRQSTDKLHDAYHKSKAILAAEKKSHNKRTWIIVGAVGGGLIGLALLCCCCLCCLKRHRKNKPVQQVTPIPTTTATTADPSVVGTEVAAVPATEKGTLGRKAEEGRAVRFPEGETKGAEAVVAPATAPATAAAPAAEKVVEAPATVVEKPAEAAEHVEAVDRTGAIPVEKPVPVTDGAADSGPATGSDRPDMGSVRGRKKNRFGL